MAEAVREDFGRTTRSRVTRHDAEPQARARVAEEGRRDKCPAGGAKRILGRSLERRLGALLEVPLKVSLPDPNVLSMTSGQANRDVLASALQRAGRNGLGKSYGNVKRLGATHPRFFDIAVFLMGRAA
jgi:hypothetical protein